MPDQWDQYQSPLASRNASARMQSIWSPRCKFTTWRRLWLALAQAQHELGLPVSREQLDEMRAHLEDIDFEAAARYERELRHDVMAHVHAFGDVAPTARAIIHLGATSQFVNCNAELLLLRDSMTCCCEKLANVIHLLGNFAAEHAAVPTLGFTHYQPAQPVTVGRRAAQWAYDLSLCLEELESRLANLRFRGVKGTTGTQASFLALFEGDHDKVEQLDALVVSKFAGADARRLLVTAQTYPRLIDGQVLSSLATLASVTHKITNDIRLLANRKELEEPFEKSQIGSSAMAYKRNPMRSERVAGLSRFVINLAGNAWQTEATQWFERTLDDSSNRRLSLAESFLATDGILDLMANIVDGMVIYPATIARNLEAELPFMATENLMMAAVKQNNADRQEVHEVIRKHSQAAAQRVKQEAMPNDLLDRLRGEAMFKGIDLEATLKPGQFVGRSVEQTQQVIADVIEPVRQKYAGVIGEKVELKV